MPLYILECRNCQTYYEVTMSLELKERFDKQKRKKKCPDCGKTLKNVMCAPRLSSQRCTVGC